MSLEKTFDEFIRENVPDILKENIKLQHTKTDKGILFSIKTKNKSKSNFCFSSTEDPNENRLVYCNPDVYKEIEKYFASESKNILIKWIEKEYGLVFTEVLSSHLVYHL